MSDNVIRTGLLIAAAVALPAGFAATCLWLKRRKAWQFLYFAYFVLFGTLGGNALMFALSPSALAAGSELLMTTVAPLACLISALVITFRKGKAAPEWIALTLSYLYPAGLAVVVIALVAFEKPVAKAEPLTLALPLDNGAYVVSTDISGPDAGPTRRNCVVLHVTEKETGKEMVFQTAASNQMKWALDWSAPQTLVLYSGDVGVGAYDIKDGKIISRTATEAEQAVARKAYERRYGRRPGN
ncbi:MAG TPA: hypothetical protein VHD32_11345 [Candidatus Didemnitutus sp.]|nr:hypothetical protein [Candidatus Didemnitutus sp.]